MTAAGRRLSSRARIRARIAALALAVATGASIGQALAQQGGYSPTGQPLQHLLRGEDYVVVGYRSARFGMTADEVRAAIAVDFGAGAEIRAGRDLVEGTSNLMVLTDTVEPAGLPALVTYVFGAESGRLITVNIVRATATDASPEQRKILVAAAAAETGHFLSYGWRLMSTAIGRPIGPNALIVFAGGDEAGGAVEVRLEGVQYEFIGEDGTRSLSPPPHGATRLRVAYTQDAGNPDIVRIPPGSF